MQDRNFAVAAIVEHEQVGRARADERVELHGRDAEAGLRREPVLERGAIGVVEADDAREAADGVIDQHVRRDHDVARRLDAGARLREQRSRGAERVRDDRVQRPDGGRDIADAVREIGEVEAMIGRVAVAGRIERDDRHAGRDERLDESAEL